MRWLMAVIAAVGVGAGVIFLIQSGSGAGGEARTAGGPASTRLPPVPRGPRRFSDAGPAQLIPRSGAYLGAFVQPAGAPSAGTLIQAVTAFEGRVGHRLGLVHVYHPWLAAFPSAADRYFASTGSRLLITWGGTGDTRAIAAGRYDALIRARAAGVKSLRRPILLEFRHEMDRPDLQRTVHSAADYISAWRHIRAVFAAVRADNVGWVWCPTAQGFADGRAQAYYPGNSEVNWICADGYSASPRQPLASVLKPFLGWASHRPKPVLIGEFGVGGDPAGWASWLAQVGQLARRAIQIKALAYFDADGRSSQGRPYKFSLTGNPSATSTFAALLAERYFRQQRIQPGAAP
jgi:hypothetical protein